MAHETVIRSSLLVRDVQNPNATAQKFAVFTGSGSNSLNTLGFRTANELLSDLGFNEAVDDRVASLLQAGSNIAISYDDNANTLTISAPNLVTGSGTATRVAFWSANTTLSSSSNLFWDNATSELGVNTGTPSASIHVIGADSNSTAFTARFANSTGTHSLTVRNDGRVGIGTDSPSQVLHVVGAMRVTASTGTGTTLMGRNASGDVSAITAGSGLGLNNNVLSFTGSTGISGTGTANKVTYWNGTSSVAADTDLHWDATNNRLGVGTATPNQTVEIAGTLRLTGSTGTGTTLMARDANGDVSAITAGSGLNLNNNVLTSTGIVNPMTASGDTIYGGASGTPTRLVGNITTTKQFLSQTGNGSASAAPVWSTVTKSDVGLSNVENTALSTWTGSTSITTLGTIATGTWNASTIAVNRGGTGAVTLTGVVIGAGTAALTGIAGTASQLLRRNAANTAYEFFTPDYVNQAGARSAISLTVTGSSGSATYSSATGVLNVPTYTLAGLGGVAGTIAAGQVAYGTASNTVGGNNNLFWDNTNVELGIGTNAPARTLHVAGTMRLTGSTGTGTTLMARDASGDVSAITVSTGLSLNNNVLTSTGLVNPMTTLGDTIYGAASGVATRLAGNITTTKQFLSQTGNGSASAAPVWSTVTKSDVGLSNVENTALSTWTGSTSITTLGTIATGTWNASTIAVNRGGTGAVTLTGVVIGAGTAALTGIAGTASQLLRRNAGNTAYEFFTHDFVNQAGARSAISLTVTGSSGAATYSSATGILNVPTYTLAGLGGVSGTGAANKLAYWNGTSSLTNDTDLHWDATNHRLGVFIATPQATLDVAGTMRLTGSTGTGTTLMARNSSGDVSAVTVSTGLSLSNNVLTSTGLVNPMTASGDTIYGGASGTATRLAGNITTTKQFLSQTGNGTVAGNPSWSTVTKSDVGLANVENTALSTWTGSSSITTIGTVTTGTWNASTIAVNRGGTGAVTLTGVVIGDGTNALTGIAGTASQLLRRNAGNTAYEFFTPDYVNQAGARSAISLTVTGNSGAATYSSATGILNVPTYTLAGLGGVAGTIAAGQVAYGTASNTIGGSNNLFWDNSNLKLGVGTNTPVTNIDIRSSAGSTISLKNGTGTTQGSVLSFIQGTSPFGLFGIGDQAGIIGGTPDEVAMLYTATSIPFKLRTGGASTSEFTFTANGRLLIGTETDDGFKLNVVGASRFADNLSVGTTSSSARLHVVGSGTTSGYGLIVTDVNNNTATASLVVQDNGRVGIGTNAPASTLHVAGTMRLTGSTGTGTTLMARDASGDVSAITVSTGLSLSNNVLTTTGTSGVSGTGTANKIAYFTGTSAIAADTDLHWDATNNRLGIGTSGPETNLHIQGTLRVTDSTGTASAILGRDGAGNVSNVTTGTGLSLSGGTLSVTGSTGFSNPMTTLGDTIYGAASGVATRLAGNITTTKQFLSQTGNGSASAAPVWSTVTKSDVGLANVENTALSTWTGSTSITTLGTIATGTWNASTIAVNRGGTGAVTLTGVVIGAGTAALTGIAGTASQLLRRNAANTAYEFFTPDYVNQAGARSAISLTVTGNSGAATYSSATGVLNVPTYTLAGLGGVAGTIAAGQVAYGTASNTVGGNNNLFWDNAAVELGIGTNAPARTLHVAGTMRLTGSTGTGTTLMARDASGDVSAVTVGTGLSLNNNTITATISPKAETPTGTINGTNTVFTLASTPIANQSVMVFLNGVAQYNGIDYTVSGTTVTFTSAPATSSSIFAYYLA